MLRFQPRLLVSLMSIWAMSPVMTRADDNWTIGTSVIVNRETRLRHGNREVKFGPLADGSNPAHRVYEIGDIEKGWLLLVDQVGTKPGWLAPKDALSMDALGTFASLRVDPTEPRGDAATRVIRGILWSRRGESEIAVAEFSDAILKDGSNALSLVHRALARRASGDRDGAASDFRRAAELGSEDAIAALVELAARRMKTKDLPGAVALFRATLHPDDPSVLENLLVLGIRQRDRKNYRDSLATFNEAMRQAPADPRGYDGRGVTKLATGDVEGALTDFGRALAIEPAHAPALIHRGFALRAKGSEAEAESAHEKALEVACDEVARRCGLLLIDLPNKNIAGVDDFYQRAVKIAKVAGPDDPRRATIDGLAIALALAYDRRGEKASKIQDVEAAILNYSRALELDPRSPGASFHRAMAHQSRKEYSLALADLNDAHGSEPNSSEILTRLAWLLATCPDAGLRDGPKALEAASLACDKASQDRHEALDALAAALAETGDFASAVAREDQALEGLQPSSKERSEYEARRSLYARKRAYRMDSEKPETLVDYLRSLLGPA